MNTVSNSQNTIDVYALRRLQETKALEQSRLQKHQISYKRRFRTATHSYRRGHKKNHKRKQRSQKSRGRKAQECGCKGGANT